MADVGRCQVSQCHDLIPRPRGHVFRTSHTQALLNIAASPNFCLGSDTHTQAPVATQARQREPQLGGASCSNLSVPPPPAAALKPGKDGMFVVPVLLSSPREGGCVMRLGSLSCVKVTRDIHRRRIRGPKSDKCRGVPCSSCVLPVYKSYTPSHSKSFVHRFLFSIPFFFLIQ